MTPEGGKSKRAILGAKTAPASGTPLALVYLESYLSGKSNRKKATQALLRCSERTASRISSRAKPYKAPMKMLWVHSICAAVGKPIGTVLGFDQPRLYQQCLNGWAHARNASEALQFATDCAAAIISRALTSYQLSGSYTLTYEGGYPRRLIVMLSTVPDAAVLGEKYALHQLIITSVDNYDGKRKKMVMLHIEPGAERLADKTFLDVKILETTLKRIHALTKNLAADIKRETARQAAEPRRRSLGVY